MIRRTGYYKIDHPAYGTKYFMVNDKNDVLQILLNRGSNDNRAGINLIKYYSFINDYSQEVRYGYMILVTEEEFYVALDAMICKLKLNHMSSVKIESGIEFPGKIVKKGNNGSKYPFKDMKKTDSFKVPGKGKKELNRIRTCLDAAWRAFVKKYKPKWYFKMYTYEDGIRIWRIK